MNWRLLPVLAMIALVTVVAAGALGGTSTLTSQGNERAVALVGGWNLVSWTGPPTAIEEALQSIQPHLQSAHAFDNATKQFRNYSPAGPAFTNTLDALAPGDAVWLRLSQAVAWDQPPPAGPVMPVLSPGFNLVSWLGTDGLGVADATASLGGVLLGVFAFDSDTQAFDTFGPDLPLPLNSLTVLPFGTGLWVQVDGDATWRQPGAEGLPAILSSDGRLASFENYAPVIREVVIDDNPSSPVAMTIVFQPDDHGIDRLELYGADAKNQGRPEFAVVHFIDSEVTARLEFDADGALEAIYVGEAALLISVGENEIQFDYQESGVSIATGTTRRDELGPLSVALAPVADLRVAQGGRTIEWRNASCTDSVVSVGDGTPVCLYIEDPALAGQTIEAVQVVEVDPLFNDLIGRPLTITFDENGVGSASFIAGWRDDGGRLGGDPEYRFDLAGVGSSPKLYVTRDAPSTLVEIRWGSAFTLLVEGKPLPEKLTVTPTLSPGTCGRDLSCSLWIEPGEPGPVGLLFGIVHVASADLGVPVQGVPLDFCGSWDAWSENTAGEFLRGRWIPAEVWDDPEFAVLVNLIAPAAGALVVDAALAVPNWHIALGALVAALAYQGGRQVGQVAAGRGDLDCEALKRQTDLLAALAHDISETEVSPEICLAPVPGFAWEAACQQITYKPFRATTFGSRQTVTFRIRSLEPHVTIEGPRTVTASDEVTYSYVAHGQGGASDEYSWRITPEPEFLFTGDGQASFGLTFLDPGEKQVCAEATDSDGQSTEVCVPVTAEAFPKTWASQTACGEVGEGDDFSHTWKVHLIDNKDGTFGGFAAFHECPGGGRAYYRLLGEGTPGTLVFTLTGTLDGGRSRGGLETRAPNKVDFRLRDGEAPEPNFAPRHDLAIALSVSPASVPVGGRVDHIIRVENDGPDPATNVLVRATISGAEHAGLPSGCESVPGGVECTIDVLPVDSVTTFRFDVTSSVPRLATTSVRFSFPDFGRDTWVGDNSDTAEYVIFDPEE